MVSSAKSYSETPASAPLIRAWYRLTSGLSSTVTLMIANCARQRLTRVVGKLSGPRSPATDMLPVKAGSQNFGQCSRKDARSAN